MLITTPTNATTPGALPEGAFARVTLAPGPNVVVIDVRAEGGYVGQLALKVAYGGENGDLRTLPLSLPASATGAWSTTIPGPGYVYVVASALTSGQPEVTLRSGPGSQATGTSLVSILTATPDVPGAVPMEGVFSSGVTLANDWVLALAGGQGHSRGAVRCKEGQSGQIVISIVPAGRPKPSAPDYTNDVKYGPISSGETYPLGEYANTGVDVWLRASDSSAGVAWLAWGMD